MNRPRKYNNTPTVYQGETYSSMGEAGFAYRLDLLKAAGKIYDWKRGREWVLLEAPKRRDRITLKPDFEVWDTPAVDSLRMVDFKGVLTREFRLKAKLWKAVYPSIPIFYVKADGTETRL